MHYLIKDTEFTGIMKSLKQIKRIHKNNIPKLRNFLEAVYYVLRSGCQWQLLPIYYGNWRSVHKRFWQWSKNKIWTTIFKLSQQDPDLEWVSLDSTVIRAHASSAGYGKDSQTNEALERSRGGFSTKIHAMTDALGNPLEYILTAGQRHDIIKAEELTTNINGAVVIADTAYSAHLFIEKLEAKQCKAEIPSRKNSKSPRAYDEHIYAERHTIECMLGKIKHFRRIFSRFDKAAQAYLSFLSFAGTLIWLR